MILAINGGRKVRENPFPSQNVIGDGEIEAANRVLKTGRLTGYQGNWGPNFFGGIEVQALEAEWAAKFGVKHAIACNSCTSGLVIACGAVENKLEHWRAMVTPYSMVCSATAPMAWGMQPIFVDIDDYYCMSAESLENRMMYPTKLALPVSLFGMGYDIRINEIAKKNNFYVIEDAAQAIGAKVHFPDGSWKYVGTLGDIGVFSFNYGKHLTAGEGGMIVTNDDELAMKCRLIMNHAEAVVNGMPAGMGDNYKTMFGFNLRITEMQAAILRVQLSRMDELVSRRVENVQYLLLGLEAIPCIETTKLRPGYEHTYYVCPLKWKGIPDMPTITREKFVEAVRAELTCVIGHDHEGVPIRSAYIKPISNMPLFGLPEGTEPNCTHIENQEIIVMHRFFGPGSTHRDMVDVMNAFHKVWSYREELV